MIFTCPCIVGMIFFNYNQQDATIFDSLFLKGSTYFGRFLRPSSGTHNCKLSFRLVSWMRWNLQFHLIHDTTSLQQYWLTIPEADCTVMGS